MKNAFAGLIAGAGLIVAGSASPQDALDVRSDIRSGRAPVSFTDISFRYDVGAVPELIALINDQSEMAHWTDAANVLGVVGDGRAVEPLIELIERPAVGSSYASKDQHDARNQAMRSLGVLVHRTGNEKALEYLIASLDDRIWRRRDVRGIVDYVENQENYDRRLSIYALFGLAYSGHPRAGEALRSLRQAPTENQERLRAGLDSTLESWLGVYDLVAEMGIAGMEKFNEERRKESGMRP